MENPRKVEDLEKEIQELKLKLSTLEEGLKSAETFINNIKNNNNNNNPNDNNNASSSTQQKAKKKSKNKVNIIPLVAIDNVPIIINPINTPTDVSATESEDNLPLASLNSKKVSNNDTPFNENNTDNGNNNTNQNSHLKKYTKNLSTESWVGKILMGIIASFLIFVALITFGKIILPYLTDNMKIILMFVASIAMTAVGFFLNQRKPENTFFKALLACGSVCIYLSILMTGIYFQAIKPLIMYILIAVWAVLIIFFKKNKNDWLFFVIGNLGYLISIFFTATKKGNQRLIIPSLIIPVLIYVIMIGMAYQIMYWKNKRQKYIQNSINIISLLIFQIIMINIFKKTNEVIIVSLVTIACSFIGLVFFMFSNIINYHKINFVVATINTIVYLIAYFLLNILFDMGLPIILSFIVVFISATVFEGVNIYWRSKNPENTESVINIVLSGALFYTATLIIAINNHFLFYSGIIMVIFSLLVVYGTIKDLTFKIQGWILVALCIFTGFIQDSKSFIIVASILILLAFIVESYVLNNSPLFKGVSYTFLLGWILRIAVYINELNIISNDYILTIVTYIIIVFINGIMIMTRFYKTKSNDDDGRNLHIILDLYNLIFILAGMTIILLDLTKDKTFKIFYMIIVVVISCINLPLKDKGNSIRYVYTAIKFFFILCCSLWNEYVAMVTFILISVFNAILIKMKLYEVKDNKEVEKSNHTIVDSFNLVLIIFGLFMMKNSSRSPYKDESTINTIIYNIVTVLLACLNIPLKDKGTEKRYIYTAVKFIGIIYYSLLIYNTENFIISICMIIFSVLCIIIGFKNRSIGKLLRIFGLVVTLIFIIKLILVDIGFKTSISKAISYLITGILCFAISAIYNYFEKKQKNNQLEELE